MRMPGGVGEIIFRIPGVALRATPGYWTESRWDSCGLFSFAERFVQRGGQSREHVMKVGIIESEAGDGAGDVESREIGCIHNRDTKVRDWSLRSPEWPEV